MIIISIMYLDSKGIMQNGTIDREISIKTIIYLMLSDFDEI